MANETTSTAASVLTSSAAGTFYGWSWFLFLGLRFQSSSATMCDNFMASLSLYIQRNDRKKTLLHSSGTVLAGAVDPHANPKLLTLPLFR